MPLQWLLMRISRPLAKATTAEAWQPESRERRACRTRPTSARVAGPTGIDDDSAQLRYLHPAEDH
eukprot:86353-Alexandrium_andersonii.AAC.1